MASFDRSAVLFDLFGTLVPGGTRTQRDAVAHAMARDLDVDPGQLAAVIRDTFDDRTTGRLGDLHSTVRSLATGLGARPDDDAVDRAVQRRLDLNRGLLAQTWAIPTLDWLRTKHVPIGVVTDCSAETPAVWGESCLASRVEAIAFSCHLGIRKPDRRIYLNAIEALGAIPERCVFVGDGASQELSGARALGVRAIWFDNVESAPVDRPNPEIGWTGERITALVQLRDLLDV